MKTNIKKINSYTRQLEVTVSWDVIEQKYWDEFKKASSQYSIPGFRKGKVPIQIVKKNLGSSIEANFAEKSINTFYKKALEKLNIVPINQASIDKLDFKEGTDLFFTAQFEVHPEIKLPNYQNKIKVKATRYIHEMEDVDDALNNYREQHATIKTIEEGAKSGYFIRGNFQVLDDNSLPIIGNKLEDQYIRLGFGLFKDDAEKVFIGAKQGDKVLVSLNNKDKLVKYEVEITKVEEQILPEIDDEFAKSINKKYSSLEELKNQIKVDLQSSLDKDHKELVKKEIINFFVNKINIDAPESMVNLYLDQIKDDLKNRNQTYDEDKFEDNYKPNAEWNIKWYLIKDSIIDEEAIEISDNEIKNKIDEIITENKDNKEEIKKYFNESKNRENLYNELLNEKLFSCLLEYSKVKVIDKSTNELRKQQAA